MTHFYHNSKGDQVDIETMHSAHLRAAAAKLRREQGEPHELADHMDAAADRKELEWFHKEPEAFAAWAERAGPEKLAEFHKRHGTGGK